MPKLITITKRALAVILLSSLCHGAQLKFEGIPEESLDSITTQLKPRLEYINAREASSWRADDSAFFLERLLIRAGHAEASVDWSLPGSNIILLKAHAGPRYKYGSITAPGSTNISQENIYQYFLQPLVETEIVSIKEAPYISEYSELGATNVANFLKSQGYWNTQVSIINEAIVPSSKVVDVTLNITTGSRLIMEQPSFQGASAEDIAAFLPEIQPYLQQAATTKNINIIRTIVTDYYSENGYQFAKISMDSDHGSSTTTLDFSIDSGKKYQVSKIIVKGEQKTKNRRIRRHFDELKDKSFNQTTATKSLNRLLATGAFSNVTLTPTPHTKGDSSKLDLVIEVDEAEAKSVSTYAGVGSFEGGILGASYTDFNYHGSLRRVELKGEVSGRGLLAEVDINEPMFAGIPIQFNTRLFLTERDYEGYDTRQAGAEISFTWRPNENYASQLFFGSSYTSSSTDGLTAQELGLRDYFNTRIGLAQTLDFRNSRILPNDGFYTRVTLQAGGINGDSDNEYLRLDLQSSYRVQLTQNDHFVARFSAAGINPQSPDLPVDVRLFSGGQNTQRAFDERELGPRSISNDPLGGEAFWTATAQYVRTISDPIKLSVFYDVGQIYSEFDDFDFTDPSHAVGLGLRIDLPIGPVKLEYGYNLNRRRGEPRGALHFAIGATF